MALNWTMLTKGSRDPVPLPHEMTITTVDSGGELTLNIPDAPPSGSSSSGGSGGGRKLKATGRFWITDQRLVFVGPPKDALESLSVPLHQILSTKFEQPTFGANKLVLEIAPSIEPRCGVSADTPMRLLLPAYGNVTQERPLFIDLGMLWQNYRSRLQLTDATHPEHASGAHTLNRGTTAEIKVSNQPLLPFVSVLDKTRERAIEARHASQEEEDDLPVYTVEDVRMHHVPSRFERPAPILGKTRLDGWPAPFLLIGFMLFVLCFTLHL